MFLYTSNFIWFFTNLTIERFTHLYYMNNKWTTNTFIDYINDVIKDPKVQIKINDLLDKNNRLPFNYQSKIEYDTLIQNVILKELINMMGMTITDLDKEIKMKISSLKYLESRLS